MNDELSKIVADLEGVLRKSVEVVEDFHLFTEDEKRAWRETEPDFRKRIATSLNPKRPRDKLTPYPWGGWVAPMAQIGTGTEQVILVQTQ